MMWLGLFSTCRMSQVPLSALYRYRKIHKMWIVEQNVILYICIHEICANWTTFLFSPTFLLVNFFSSLFSLEITIALVKKCLCGHSEQDETYCNCLTFSSGDIKIKEFMLVLHKLLLLFNLPPTFRQFHSACQLCHCNDLFCCPAVFIFCTNPSTLHR